MSMKLITPHRNGSTWFSRAGAVTAVITALFVLSDSDIQAAESGQPILLAQAAVEDGRTGPYSVVVPQVGGGSKTVEYFKDKNGLIIPLPVENGKLVDGSDAPMDPLRAKVKQRSALVKYAKLTSARRIDLIVAASTESEKILVLAEQGSLTKELLFKGFFYIYITKMGILSEDPKENKEIGNKSLNGLESYGKNVLKINDSEIRSIKQLAESKAKEEILWSGEPTK